jgi:hypothetical protein
MSLQQIQRLAKKHQKEHLMLFRGFVAVKEIHKAVPVAINVYNTALRLVLSMYEI